MNIDVVIGSGIGGLVTGVVWIGSKVVSRWRNGAAPPNPSPEGVRQELHERVTREMAHVEDHYVRTDLCKIVSKQLQRDIDAIRDDTRESRKNIDRLVAHTLGE